MNGIENIKNKILEEAEQEAAKAEASASQQAAEILEKAKKAAQRDSEVMIERGKAQAADTKERMLASSALEQRKLILKAKQELLKQAFDKAEEKLLAMSGTEYEEWLVSLAVKASNTGSEELVLPAGAQELAEKVVSSANAELAKNGKTAKLTLSKDSAPFEKGLLLREDDTEVNCSLEALMSFAKENLVSEVAEVLFK